MTLTTPRAPRCCSARRDRSLFRRSCSPKLLTWWQGAWPGCRSGAPSCRARGEFRLEALTGPDLDRMAELVETYADLPLGTVDASVVALAERLGLTSVGTLDRRHFTVVR